MSTIFGFMLFMRGATFFLFLPLFLVSTLVTESLWPLVCILLFAALVMAIHQALVRWLLGNSANGVELSSSVAMVVGSVLLILSTRDLSTLLISMIIQNKDLALFESILRLGVSLGLAIGLVVGCLVAFEVAVGTWLVKILHTDGSQASRPLRLVRLMSFLCFCFLLLLFSPILFST